MKKYNSIAKIYDHFWWYKDSVKLFDIFYEKIKLFKIDSSLDLACWTWELVKHISNLYNIRWTWTDISEEMIKVSKNKFCDLIFFVDDMTNLKNLNNTFDLITCIYDNINHLNNLRQVQKMFKNVYNKLNDWWLFCFDIQTTKHINNWVRDCSWEDKWYKLKNTWKIIWENKIKIDIEVFNNIEKYKLSFIWNLWNLEDIVFLLNKVWFINIELIWNEIKLDKYLIIAKK